MSKFVTGEELANVVYNILFEAKEKLVLVSPFIKLDAYFRKILDQHVHNPQLEILVVFGKNPGHVTRSVSREDLDYFTKFQNITLVYAPTLHAKYYGNEAKGVVTSINLYDYSFEHNIEFGVYSERPQLVEKILESVGNKNMDDQAFAQAVNIAATHDVIFARRPCFKLRNGFLGKLLNGRDYLEPAILFNAIEDLIANRPFPSSRLSEFPKEVAFEQTLAQVLPTRQEVPVRPSSTQWSSTATPPTHSEPRQNPALWGRPTEPASHQGYCIRTGEPIPFNPERPFSYSAYKSWASFGNDDYPERYCHKTGEPSLGRTSMRHPILKRF